MSVHNGNAFYHKYKRNLFLRLKEIVDYLGYLAKSLTYFAFF
ncbi:hypothetical protein M2140_001848 [Clostridiales Family XIII bacterium PM5-7]